MKWENVSTEKYIGKDGKSSLKLVYGGENKKCKDCVFFYKDGFRKITTRCEKHPKKTWEGNQEACIYFKK